VYDLSIFEDMNNLDNGFFSNRNVIVDNEIMNDISDDWDYEKAKIAVTGTLHLDRITVFVATKENDEEFKEAVRTELIALAKDNPLYSFNTKMEMGNFKGDLNLEIPINEIKPFNARGWNKNRFFETLRERNVIPDIDLKDIFGGNANLCIEHWQKYLEDGSQQHLMDIVSHNINCLLKESIIQKHKDFFVENWEIDKNRFMLREKDGR